MKRPSTATRAALCAIALCACLGGPVSGQATSPPSGDQARVFLDCSFCDFDHLRVETPWVAFVRDRTASDVHLLLTSTSTGAGGQQYTIDIIGQGRFVGRRDTLTFSTEPNSTADERRTEIVRNIQLALLPYALRTSGSRGLRVAAKSGGDEESSKTSGRDKWNAWVFEIGSSGSVSGEQLQNDLEVDAEATARRITAALKFGASLEGNFSRSRFTLDDGEIVVNRRESYEGGAVIVRSIARKWGLGVETSVTSSTFRNTRLGVRTAGALEYSFFPYEEATRRQLVAQYSVGLSSFRYREETIYDKLAETRPSHALVAGYDVRQPWGRAELSAQAASFIDDPSQHRLEVEGSVSFRVIRGLNFNAGGGYSLIHDQLAIVKRDATPEEILLQRRALRTDYSYFAHVGFSYSFGSIFNSVVNPRFGTGPGDVLH